MTRRLDGRVAIIVGGGQTPGLTIGNGRATAIMLAREGAYVVVSDRDVGSALQTLELIEAEGNAGTALECDITHEEQVAGMIDSVLGRFGKIDILHNNVGSSLPLGDAPAAELTADAFQRSFDVNLKGMWLTCKYSIASLRETRGSIVNLSSTAVRGAYPLLGYQTMKQAVLGLTRNLANANAAYGVRVNAILPGLIETPLAIDARLPAGVTRDEYVAKRNASVPLLGGMGTGWDVANAALFLHSDEASFITGVELIVDGGQSISWRPQPKMD